MILKREVSLYFLVVFFLIGIAACSSKPVSLGDLPVYTGATEHKTGSGGIGDTLKNNNQMDAAMRNAAGVGGKTEQKGFLLPKDATWDGVKAFYDEKLKDAGWKSGTAGNSGSMVSGMLDVANKNNPTSKTAVWSRGKQTLTVLMLNNPVSKEKDLILSLSSI